MTDKPWHACEVLILGAGPAGCSTAIGLLTAGVERVLLVDKPIAQPFRIGESATPDVAVLLAELGLSGFEKHGHLPYHGNLSAWGDTNPMLDHFLFHARGHGWHLDRAAFDARLRQEAVARGARLVSPATVAHIVPDKDGWQATVQGLGEVSARVAVDATGRRSILATRLGARRYKVDSLQAIAAHAIANTDLAGLSLVESFADGWWYATGLPDGRALVTLMTDSDIATAKKLNQPSAFAQAWRETTLLARHVSMPDEPLRLGTFAAHSGFIDRAAGPRWICVGDALMGFDPLTSSGISGALNDAIAAVPTILGQLDNKADMARAYAARADSTFRRYMFERQKRYATEQRWADRKFWARRNHQALDNTFQSAA